MPKALIVDDDLFIRQVLLDLLEGAGFAVVQAGDGDEGLRVALEERPEVILLDLVMPGIDGIETCRKLRACPELKHTPILLMTAREDLEGKVNPFQIGADDYIPKPFDGRELVARVQGSLVKSRAMAALDRKARDYEALLDISSSVSSSLDTVEILRRVAERVSNILFHVRGCSVALIQEDGNDGYVLSSSDDPNLGGLRIFLDHSPEIRKVMETAEPVVLSDQQVVKNSAAGVAGLLSSQFNTVLLLPVELNGRVTGAMVVRAEGRQSGFKADEVELCRMVANTSASALKNAMYYQRLRQESKTLENDKRRVEEELRVKALYEQLFDSASEGLAAINGQGEVVFANQKALNIIGCARKDLRGLDFTALLAENSLHRVLKWLKRVEGDAESSERFDVTICDHRGVERLLSLSLSDRTVGGDLHVVAFRDVTRKRQMEQELSETRRGLEEANLRLEQASIERAEYLNAAAHDLRIPVTIVSGYCSLLEELGTDNLTAEQREYLDAAQQSSDRLVDLINSMLDLSRIEAGKIVMDIEVRDLAGVLQDISRHFHPLAAKHDHRIVVNSPDSCLARFDAENIHRVLVNLVGNAMKYSPAGGQIRLNLQEDEHGVQVSVEDSGGGIPEERISELFEKFSQLDREDSRRGTGLGLYICKKIIDAHQGKIWAESTLGQGSRFCFTLPTPSEYHIPLD